MPGHFTLPNAAWWEDFYAPMRARVRELREKYAHDAEARGILDVIGREPELHAAHSDCYAYELRSLREKWHKSVVILGNCAMFSPSK